jgi:hypothetical protein
MADPTNKSELLDQIRQGRTTWEALLAQVEPERLTEPGVEGDWSLKDVIAHIAFWEGRAVKRLQAVARGKAPTPHPIIKNLDTDDANAWIYNQNENRPLAEVQAEEQALYEQLLAALEPISDADLFTPSRFAWLDGNALWETIPGNSYGHYEEHIPPLQAWLAAARI